MRTSARAIDRPVGSIGRTWALIAASLAAVAMFDTAPAFGFLARPAIFAKLASVTKAPSGWLRFCAENPRECRPSDDGRHDVILTPDLLQQLFSINAYVNDRVKWTPDAELYGTDERWAYPLDRGDCEDIVLLKRRLLAAAGWPVNALLITTVDNHGEIGRHAVLTVLSDRGDLILDNLTPEILFWYETSYRFLARQSTADPNVWLAFSADQPRPEARQTDQPN